MLIPSKKGRLGKYGEKWTAERVEKKLRQYNVLLHVYGKPQWMGYRSTLARTRFLKGREVLAVWVQFEDDHGFGKPPLLLCTHIKLTAIQVIKQSAQRWLTEPMFN